MLAEVVNYGRGVAWITKAHVTSYFDSYLIDSTVLSVLGKRSLVVAGEYGTIAYEGVVTQISYQNLFIFHIEELNLRYIENAHVNVVPVAYLRRVRLVATDGLGGPVGILFKDDVNINEFVSLEKRNATLANILLRIPKDIAYEAEDLGFALIGKTITEEDGTHSSMVGHTLMWPLSWLPSFRPIVRIR